MVILLLSNKWDISIDYIVDILQKKDLEYMRINTEDLINSKSSASFPDFSFNINQKGRSMNLVDSLKSVLFRRPGKPYEFSPPDKKPSESILNFITDQWYAFLSGLQSIPDVLWINNPQKNNFAEMKINQLLTASKIGLKIPRTCITSDKQTLSHFDRKINGKIIAKALYSPLISEKNDEFFIFSNRISDVVDITEEELALAPTIFQEELENKRDYRITIVGTDCFSVEITSKDTSVLDWRRVKNGIKIQECEMPNDIQEKCIKLVKNLGLVFGAIDLINSNDNY